MKIYLTFVKSRRGNSVVVSNESQEKCFMLKNNHSVYLCLLKKKQLVTINSSRSLIPQSKIPKGSSHTVAVVTASTTCYFHLKNVFRLPACATR